MSIAAARSVRGMVAWSSSSALAGLLAMDSLTMAVTSSRVSSVQGLAESGPDGATTANSLALNTRARSSVVSLIQAFMKRSGLGVSGGDQGIGHPQGVERQLADHALVAQQCCIASVSHQAGGNSRGNFHAGRFSCSQGGGG